MSLPIDFQVEAINEVDAAFEWYEQQRAGLGEEFFTALLNQLESIQENPEAYAILYRNVGERPLARQALIVLVAVTDLGENSALLLAARTKHGISLVNITTLSCRE